MSRTISKKAAELHKEVLISKSLFGGKSLNPRGFEEDDGNNPSWHNIVKAYEEKDDDE